MTAKKGGLLIYICTGLLLTGGVSVSVSTLWYVHRVSYLFWLSDYGFELGAGMMLVAGAMLSLPAGWLAIKLQERRKNLAAYTTLLCLVGASMLLLTTGMSITSGLSRGLQDHQTLNTSMLEAMSFEKTDRFVMRAFCNLQNELKCCGVNSHNDWWKHRFGDLPPSCCGRTINKGTICVNPIYTGGCLKMFLEELHKYVDAMAVFTYSLILILALFLAVLTLVVMTDWLVNKSGRGMLLNPVPPQPDVTQYFL